MMKMTCSTMYLNIIDIKSSIDTTPDCVCQSPQQGDQLSFQNPGPTYQYTYGLQRCDVVEIQQPTTINCAEPSTLNCPETPSINRSQPPTQRQPNLTQRSTIRYPQPTAVNHQQLLNINDPQISANNHLQPVINGE